MTIERLINSVFSLASETSSFFNESNSSGRPIEVKNLLLLSIFELCLQRSFELHS